MLRDLDLPVPGDPAVLIVIAAVTSALGLLGLVAGWVEGRLSVASLLSALLGAALFLWMWEIDRAGFGPMSVPMAFVEIVARILR